jgi:hypothetical protein
MSEPQTKAQEQSREGELGFRNQYDTGGKRRGLPLRGVVQRSSRAGARDVARAIEVAPRVSPRTRRPAGRGDANGGSRASGHRRGAVTPFGGRGRPPPGLEEEGGGGAGRGERSARKTRRSGGAR